jgi:hypothetical protein
MSNLRQFFFNRRLDGRAHADFGPWNPSRAQQLDSTNCRRVPGVDGVMVAPGSSAEPFSLTGRYGVEFEPNSAPHLRIPIPDGGPDKGATTVSEEEFVEHAVPADGR